MPNQILFGATQVVAFRILDIAVDFAVSDSVRERGNAVSAAFPSDASPKWGALTGHPGRYRIGIQPYSVERTNLRKIRVEIGGVFGTVSAETNTFANTHRLYSDTANKK